MNVKKVLKKMRITNVQELDFRVKENLVKAISNKISDKFADYGVEYSHVFLKLINTNMYLADIEKDGAKVCYIYKNESMYFDRAVDVSNVNTEILRASILRLQEVRNRSRKIQRLGICEIDKVKSLGVGINEAAVEYLLYKLEDGKEEEEIAYGIMLNSVSEAYPTIANIVRQMALIVGDNNLIPSVMSGTNEFKKEVSKACSGSLYNKILRNTDLIYNNKNNIIDLNRKILFDKKVKETKKRVMRSKIEMCSMQIQSKYVLTQQELCTTYFNKQLNKAKTVEELESAKAKLKEYSSLIGISENPAENFFEKYSLELCYNMDIKAENIVRNNTALTLPKKGKLKTAVMATKKITQTTIENKESEIKESNK